MPPTPRVLLPARARAHGARAAVVDPAGTCCHAELLAGAERVAAALLGARGDLDEARVAFLVAPDRGWVRAQWGIWLAGGVAVPLCARHPRPELAHVLDDCGAEQVVVDAAHREALVPLAAERGLRLRALDELAAAAPRALPEVDAGRRAMILYTSGTTGRPKGVVSTHRNLAAQVEMLVRAWGWRADDRALLVLPLHHVHGIVNVVGCALAAGAVCEMMPGFDAVAVWERFAAGGLTVFMAVPTIYHRLVAAFDAAPGERRARWAERARALRLMVSGSAALPVPLFERWREITGHALLERYGMTEIGMALSNPLRGERRPGTVGTPLPGVAVRLVGEGGEEVADGEPGEVMVRGEAVFLEYHGRPDATQEAFEGGWFRTGDVAVVEDGRWRMLGRRSVDILKTGGFKVSALEVEQVLLAHPEVAECAVVGLPDEEWGERVATAVVRREGCELGVEELRGWLKERLAGYKVPSVVRWVEELPRNEMGKVTKAEVVKRLVGR